jgi:hypothetical protein
MYDTTSIRRVKFIYVIKDVTLQYAETEAKNVALNNDESAESKHAFLDRINSTIIEWRNYLASIVDDGPVMNDAKVDEFVAMVERAKKIYGEGEDKDTLNRKRKR